MNDFIELHDKSDGKSIIVRVKAIDCVRSYSLNSYTATILTIGNKEYNVAESYEEIKNMILEQPMIKWEYKEEDKEQIKEFLKELQSYPIMPLTFAINNNRDTIVGPDQCISI